MADERAQLVHDLNNDLAVIMAAAELERDFSLILNASHRLRHHLRTLLDLLDEDSQK